MNLKNNSAFTLIEVLVALVILAIAMVGVMKVLADSTQNVVHLREKMEAHWVAMNVMGRMQTMILSLPSNTDDLLTGDEIMMNEDFYWKAGRVSGIDQQTNLVYQRVFVDVSTEQNHQAILEHLEGFVRLPYEKPFTST